MEKAEAFQGFRSLPRRCRWISSSSDHKREAFADTSGRIQLEMCAWAACGHCNYWSTQRRIQSVRPPD